MREKWIDTAKGIAILLVIIGHVSGGLEGIWNFSFVYGIHLVIFFVLSGYTSKKKRINGDYVNARFSRLMVPYFYTCLMIMLTDIFNSYIIHHDGSLLTVTRVISKNLIRSFFASGTYTQFGTVELGTKIGAIWFLPAMFFATVLFQAAVNVFDSNETYAGVSLALIAIVGYISARFIWIPFSIQSGMMGAFFMWIGFIIHKNKLLSKISWHHYLLAQTVLLLGILFEYCNVNFVTADINDLILSVLVGLAGCLLVYALSLLYKGRMFAYIGQISLTVLCVHLYALEALSAYVNKFLDLLGLEGNPRIWVCIAVEVLFAVVLASAIEKIKSFFSKQKSMLSEKGAGSCKKILAADITKGMLILSVLISSFTIDDNLRGILYSCHAMAFIFLYGCFYKESRTAVKTGMTGLKAFLIPYGFFVLTDLLLNSNRWSLSSVNDRLSQYALGMSFSKKLFSAPSSVGLVYLILLIFFTALIYTAVDKLFKTDGAKWAVCLILSLFGLLLGKTGYWLPWSLDIACYAIIFYRLGHQFHQKQWLKTAITNPFLYFVLSPIWAYMIYLGGLEPAVRKYEPYGILIIGSLAGTLLVISLAVYISSHLPIVGMLLKIAGESFIILLIVHTVLGDRIGTIAASVFSSSGFAYMILCIMLEGAISIAIKQLMLPLQKTVPAS